MKVPVVGLLLLLVVTASAEKANPIGKVLQLIGDLQAKIVAEGEAEQKSYEEFVEWCEDTAKEKGFEVKTAKGQAEELSADIGKADSDMDALSSKIEDLSGAIGKDMADLKAATQIRKKEQADFEAEARQLSNAIDALSRAQSQLEKEQGSAAFLQDGTDDGAAERMAKPTVEALQTILEALAISSEDKTRLAALMQEGQLSEDEDGMNNLQEALGAPKAAVYESHSGGILQTLADMQEKAEAQLDEKQKAEMNAKHNFDLLKQSLEDQIAANTKELDEDKKTKAQAAEAKAAAEGDLSVVQADLAEDERVLHEVHGDCMERATQFEATVQERDAELEALAKAEKFISETTGAATERTYDAAASSFLQLRSQTHMKAKTKAEMARFRALKVVKGLARQVHSAVLAQLANRMSEAIRSAALGGDDPFVKVKGMISEMVEKLEAEASAEAAKKAYCDKEMAKTKKSKEDKETTLEDLTAKIDKAEAGIAKLKDEVAELQAELADLAKSQAEMDKIRQNEKEEFTRAKAELEQGLDGVETALKVLRDYYAKDDDAGAAAPDATELMQEHAEAKAPATGAARGIIGMLEVAASDFSKNLADITAEEDAAAEEYNRITKENQITKATKDKDVMYKTKQGKSLEKFVAEAKEDRSGVQTELNAVLEYFAKLKPECISKPEPYEERKRRREAEIAGLREALQTLEGEAVFLQLGMTTHLRGIRKA